MTCSYRRIAVHMSFAVIFGGKREVAAFCLSSDCDVTGASILRRFCGLETRRVLGYASSDWDVEMWPLTVVSAIS